MCNWVDWADPEGQGGGVALYQRHMAAALAGAGITASFLSAGLAHDLRPGPPRWQARQGPAGAGQTGTGQTGAGPGAHFEIVNSAVLAPGHASWGNPAQIAHGPTEAAFDAFLQATGPYDAVQFDNLEGFPARVLEVARARGLRVVVMLHNYYPLCPQVNLWHREAETCPGFDAGRRCTRCLPHAPAPEGLRRTGMALAGAAGRIGGARGIGLYRRAAAGLRAGAGLVLRGAGRGRARGPADPAADPPPPDPAAARAFADRRAAMVGLINGAAHAVGCVSGRVQEIAAAHGLAPGLLHLTPIGTPEAARFDRSRPRPALLDAEGRIRLAYLGYMRRDKGFFFLLDALAALPPALAGRLHLTLGARQGPPGAMAQLAALRPRLAGLVHHDGYTRDRLDALLAGVTLGVVPVLWEDNLPQVALEMHLRGIPLLCSDRGGARELGRCPDLVFPAGDPAAFADRLAAVLDGRIDPAAYWAGAQAPQTMAGHIAAMRPLWSGAA